MSLILSGSDGVSDIDGTAATPAIRGTDANTGIFFPAADTIAFAEGGAEAMRINASGDVGIGTSSPSAKLQVDSSSTTYSANIRVRNGNFGNGVIGAASGILTVATDMNNLAFYTASNLGVDGTSVPTNERMRIDSSGNLLVGTTTALGGKVNIEAGTSGQTTPIMIGNGSGAARAAMNYDIDNIRLGFGCGTSPTTNGVYLTSGGTSWTSASDERLKENLVSITDAINKVISLRAVTGNFIADETKTCKAFLIAQDIQKVLPEAVDASDPTRLGVQYQDVIPLLVAAIQELKATVDAQAARIAALENPPAPTPIES